MEIHPLFEKYYSEITDGIFEYQTNEDSQQFKALIERIVGDIYNMDTTQMSDEELHSYMKIAERLVDFSLVFKDFTLGNSIYQRLCPGFMSSFIHEQEMHKKENQWNFSPALVMNYFTIQHNLFGITDKQFPSLGLVLKWFKSHNGFINTNKPLFINMLIATHDKWKEEVTAEEEETLWTEITNWMVQDLLNVESTNITLYEKAKGFYNDYKKTKRLNSSAYRIVEYMVTIIGVSEGKLEYSSLLDKAATFLKHMKQPFCERQGERLSSVFSQIFSLWEPTEHYSEVKRIEKMIREINATVYKKKIFANIINDGIHLSNWYSNKAYSLIAFFYQEELLSKSEIEDHLFEIAYSLAFNKKYKSAKKLYEKLAQTDRATDPVYNNLGVIYNNIDKNYDKALEYFEIAAKMDPEESLYQNNIDRTMDLIKKEKEKPKRQLENYFKKTDKQLKSICFTIYKLDDLDKIEMQDIENVTSFKGTYLKKQLSQLENLELIFHDSERGWRLEAPIQEKVENYVDPKLERQIIRNNQAVMYRPIFYHEAEITLYRVLTELFPQHFVFPNMDLKTIIQVEKIRNHLERDLLDYMFKAHVDFAIIDTTTYFPILTFERDSEFQDVEPQKTNAIKKNMIFQTSGLPLIRIRYNNAMDYERLKEEIKQTTKEYILQISGNIDAETRRILESIDPKRFGVLEDLPSPDDLKESWGNLVGDAIASHTKSLELDTEQHILRVTVEQTARPILELGADSIKSELYQRYPILNSVQFYWV